MCRHHQLHLENFPWPVSVLKFNRALNGMVSGDDMVATIRDPDVVGNIRQLLSSQPDLQFDVFQIRTGYRIRVVKG